MPTPWAVIISLGVLAFAILIDHFFSEVFEEQLLHFVGVFFVIYVIAAFAVGRLNPIHF
jgi:hypothetical protein